MTDPTYHLEGIIRSREEMQDFEGPLSLILLLLAKNKVEIRDIRISEILEQYLAFLDKAQSMDLEIASEFVQMASHLVYIKTKTLLAGTEEVSELELLISSLEQLRSRDTFAAVKEGVPALAEAMERGRLVYSTPPEPLPRYGAYDYRHEPWELLASLAGMLSRGTAVPEEETAIPVPRPIVYSVRVKGRQLITLLQERTRDLRELYALCRTRSELVATFVSLLELCAAGNVFLEKNGEDYMVRYSGGDAESVLERMEE